MSVRLRRLQADYERVSRLFRGNGMIEVKSASGNPPEKYQIEYRVRGLEQNGNRIVTKNHHLVEIVLPFGYPREAPQCRMLTPVFHPNIAPHAICIGDHWAAGESLGDLIIRIGEMICYQSYNIKSPLNGEAARWADENIRKLPIDSSDLSQITRQIEDPLRTWEPGAEERAAVERSPVPEEKEKGTLYEFDSDPGLELIVTQDDRAAGREEPIEEEPPLEDRVRISYHDTSSEKITNIITRERILKGARRHQEVTRYCWRCGYRISETGGEICSKCGHRNR